MTSKHQKRKGTCTLEIRARSRQLETAKMRGLNDWRKNADVHSHFASRPACDVQRSPGKSPCMHRQQDYTNPPKVISPASPPKLFRRPHGMAFVNALFGGWTVVVLLFFYIPILFLVVYSFNSSRLNIIWESFTLKWYAELWNNTRLIAALKSSLVVACITTALSVMVGTAAAWLLYRYRYHGTRAIGTLAYIPMVVPEIIMGISLLVFFKTIHFDLGYTTVIIAHTTFCFPFVMAAVQARLAGLDPSMEEAALDLGATPLKAFWYVIVPYLMPGIISGALMAFALSMDELIVTYFVKSSASSTLPIVIYGMAKVGLNPMINALSTLFIVATIILLVASEWVKRIRR